MKAYELAPTQAIAVFINGVQHRALVTAVDSSEKSIYMEFETEDPELSPGAGYYFLPFEEVKFPRRPDGSNKIWDFSKEGSEIPVQEVCINDILPPEGGWSENSDYGDGLLVKGIRFVEHPMKKGSFYWEVRAMDTEQSYRILAPEVYPFLNSEWSRIYDYHEQIRPKAEKPDERKPVSSGRYKNFFSGEEVVFKIEKRKGRPPRNCKPAPETWDDWELVEGLPHPSDPRYN